MQKNDLENELVDALEDDVAYIGRHRPSTPLLHLFTAQVRAFRDLVEEGDDLNDGELMDGIIEDVAHIEAHRPSTTVLYLLAEQVCEAREITQWADELKAGEHDLGAS